MFGLKKRIYKQIDQSNVVSFNLFETLLVRPYLKSTDMFLHLEKAYQKKGFYIERIKTEISVRESNQNLEDVSLDLIYNSISQEYREMKEKELNWDKMILRVNGVAK